MNAYLHHLAYDFKTGIRDRAKLLMFYLFPLVFFLLMGALMTQVNPFFKDTMLAAMSLFAIMSAALLTLPSVLVDAREKGVFRSYRINGVPRFSILSIPVLSTAVHMGVISSVIAIAGPMLYGGVVPSNIPGYIAAGLFAYFSFAGFGILIGVAAGNANSSVLLAQMLFIPSIMLGGLMMPVSIFPDALQRIAFLLPASHCMKLYSSLGFPQAGQVFPWISLIVLACGIILCFVLSAVIFQWDTRASQPNRKVFAGLVAILPFAIAAALGAN
jgi:ABC-2 type transport system permease protein